MKDIIAKEITEKTIEKVTYNFNKVITEEQFCTEFEKKYLRNTNEKVPLNGKNIKELYFQFRKSLLESLRNSMTENSKILYNQYFTDEFIKQLQTLTLEYIIDKYSTLYSKIILIFLHLHINQYLNNISKKEIIISFLEIFKRIQFCCIKILLRRFSDDKVNSIITATTKTLKFADYLKNRNNNLLIELTDYHQDIHSAKKDQKVDNFTKEMLTLLKEPEPTQGNESNCYIQIIKQTTLAKGIIIALVIIIGLVIVYNIFCMDDSIKIPVCIFCLFVLIGGLVSSIYISRGIFKEYNKSREIEKANKELDYNYKRHIINTLSDLIERNKE